MANLKHMERSLWKFANDFMEELIGLGLLTDAEYLNWDAVANINELPQKDLFGPAGFACVEDDKTYQVTISFGIATLNDENLFRMSDAKDRLFDRLSVTNKIPIYDADTTDEIGWFVLLNGTQLSPVARTEVRPLQFVQCSMLASLTAKPA